MPAKPLRGSMTRRDLLRGAIGIGAFGLGAVLAACGQAPAPTQAPAPAAPKPAEAPKPTEAPKPAAQPAAKPGAKAKVVWFVRPNQKENTWEANVTKDWNAKQTASEVEIILGTGSMLELSQKKTQMIAAGEEVSVWSPAWVGIYGEEYLRGLLYDLTDALKRDKWDWSDFDLASYEPYRVKGHDYGIVLLSNMCLFVYNIDLFQAAGVPEPPKTWGDPAWTWDEVYRRLKAVTKMTGDPRTSVYGSAPPGGWISNQARTFNGADYGEAGDPFLPEWWAERISVKLAWNTPEVIEHLRWRQKLIKEQIEPNPETASVLSQLGNPFLTGRIAAEPWGANFFGYKDIKAFKWGLAPFPHPPGKKPFTHLYVDNWVINANTKVFDPAWEFVKYLASAEGMKSYMLATGIMVPRKSLYLAWIDDSGYYNKTELRQLVKDCFANAKDSDNHHFGGYENLYNTVVQETDALWTLKEGPETVLPRLKQRFEEGARQVKTDIDRIRGK